MDQLYNPKFSQKQKPNQSKPYQKNRNHTNNYNNNKQNTQPCSKGRNCDHLLSKKCKNQHSDQDLKEAQFIDQSFMFNQKILAEIIIKDIKLLQELIENENKDLLEEIINDIIEIQIPQTELHLFPQPLMKIAKIDPSILQKLQQSLQNQLKNQKKEEENEEKSPKNTQKSKIYGIFQLLDWKSRFPEIEFLDLYTPAKNKLLHHANLKYANHCPIYYPFKSQQQIEKEEGKKYLKGIYHVIDDQKIYIKTDQSEHKYFFEDAEEAAHLKNRALHQNEVIFEPYKLNNRQKREYAEVIQVKRTPKQQNKRYIGVIQRKSDYFRKIDPKIFFEDSQNKEHNLDENEEKEKIEKNLEKFSPENILQEELYFRPINIEYPPMKIVFMDPKYVLKDPNLNLDTQIFEGFFEDWHENSLHPFLSIEDIYGNLGNIQDMGRMYLEESGAKTDRFSSTIENYIKDKFTDKKGNLILKKKDKSDLSNLFTFSIDNESSRALDDAFSIEEIDKSLNDNFSGNKKVYRVYIHISNTSYFVRESTKKNKDPVDDEAKNRKQTLYIKNFVRHMLPNSLAFNLASLKQGQERYALTVTTEIDEDGLVNLDKLDIVVAVIKNDEKLSYEAVDNFLSNDDDKKLKSLLKEPKNLEKLKENLQILEKICQKRRNLHQELGNHFFENESMQKEVIVNELMTLCNELVLYYCQDHMNLTAKINEYKILIKEENERKKQAEKERKEKLKAEKERKKKEKQEKKLKLEQQKQEKLKKLKELKQKKQTQKDQQQQQEDDGEQDEDLEQEIQQQEQELQEIEDNEQKEDEELSEPSEIDEKETQDTQSEISDIKESSSESESEDDLLGAVDMEKMDLQTAKRQFKPLQEVFSALGGSLDITSRSNFQKCAKQIQNLHKNDDIISKFIIWKLRVSNKWIQILINDYIKKNKPLDLKKKISKKEERDLKKKQKSHKSQENEEKSSKNEEKPSKNEEKPSKKEEKSSKKEEKSSKKGQKYSQKDKKEQKSEMSLVEQVEFYLSDKNLEKDEYFYKKLEDNDQGYMDLSNIMSCKKIQNLKISQEELIEEINTKSKTTEITEIEDKFMIRRKDNAPLPKFIGKQQKNQRNNKKYDNKKYQKNVKQTKKSNNFKEKKKEQQEKEKEGEEEDKLSENLHQSENEAEQKEQEQEQDNQIQDQQQQENNKQEESKQQPQEKETQEDSQQNQQQQEQQEQQQQQQQQQQELQQQQEQEKQNNSEEQQENTENPNEIAETQQQSEKELSEEQKAEQERIKLQKQQEKLQKEQEKQLKQLQQYIKTSIINPIISSAFSHSALHDPHKNESLIQKYATQKSKDKLHFTNPLRNYADLMTHRIVKEYIYFEQDFIDFTAPKSLSKAKLNILKDTKEDILDMKEDLKTFMAEESISHEAGLEKAERFIQKYQVCKDVYYESKFEDAIIVFINNKVVNIWNPTLDQQELLTFEDKYFQVDNQYNRVNVKDRKTKKETTLRLFDKVEIEISCKDTFPFQYDVYYQSLTQKFQKPQQQNQEVPEDAKK